MSSSARGVHALSHRLVPDTHKQSRSSVASDRGPAPSYGRFRRAAAQAVPGAGAELVACHVTISASLSVTWLSWHHTAASRWPVACPVTWRAAGRGGGLPCRRPCVGWIRGGGTGHRSARGEPRHAAVHPQVARGYGVGPRHNCGVNCCNGLSVSLGESQDGADFWTHRVRPVPVLDSFDWIWSGSYRPIGYGWIEVIHKTHARAEELPFCESCACAFSFSI